MKRMTENDRERHNYQQRPYELGSYSETEGKYRNDSTTDFNNTAQRNYMAEPAVTREVDQEYYQQLAERNQDEPEAPALNFIEMTEDDLFATIRNAVKSAIWSVILTILGIEFAIFLIYLLIKSQM